MYILFFQWLEKLMLPCIWKLIFTIECPGCGFQRSVLLLFQGQIQQSLITYWATIPVLLMFMFCIYHLLFSIRNGSKILLAMYLFNGILIFCNYFYKLTHHLIF
jgi:hypothetical protein